MMRNNAHRAGHEVTGTIDLMQNRICILSTLIPNNRRSKGKFWATHFAVNPKRSQLHPKIVLHCRLRIGLQ